ncbi:MAG: MGMT family protein [Candidatus Saccharimonadales bacterium]
MRQRRITCEMGGLMDAPGFREAIYQKISELPDGKITTYGDLAALAGHPYAARVVVGICHYGPTELPWHRLVNRFGGLASGFPGGREVQEELLRQDGFTCTDFVVDNFAEKRWRPEL